MSLLGTKFGEFGDRVMREYGAKYGTVCHQPSGCESGFRQHNWTCAGEFVVS